MKKIFTLYLLCFTILALNAHSQGSGHSEGTSIETGMEILQLFPPTMGGQPANTADDRVTAASAVVGVTVHRTYGDALKEVTLEVITDSPSKGNVNADLNRSNPGKKTKTKVNGYTTLVQPFYGDASKTGYELFIPLKQTTLLTMKVFDYTMDELLAMAATIPISEIEEKVN